MWGSPRASQQLWMRHWKSLVASTSSLTVCDFAWLRAFELMIAQFVVGALLHTAFIITSSDSQHRCNTFFRCLSVWISAKLYFKQRSSVTGFGLIINFSLSSVFAPYYKLLCHHKVAAMLIQLTADHLFRLIYISSKSHLVIAILKHCETLMEYPTSLPV